MEVFSVLITGANRGIGLEFTKQFLQSKKPPKYVFATYRSQDGLQALEDLRATAPEGTSVKLIKMDVRDGTQVESAKKIIEDQVGENGLTLLINNAGVCQAQQFPDVTIENMNLHFEVNTIGPFMIAQAMYPLLKKAASRKNTPGMSFSKAGILNISAGLGSIEMANHQMTMELPVTAYKISKAALNMAMRIITAKVKEDNILCVLMCPGWVKTDMGTDEAILGVEASIDAMMHTIAKLNEGNNGTFMDRNGLPYPW